VTISKESTQKRLCKYCPYCGSPDIKDARSTGIQRESKYCTECCTYFEVQENWYDDFGDDEKGTHG
jgi:hypothetical protein